MNNTNKSTTCDKDKKIKETVSNDDDKEVESLRLLRNNISNDNDKIINETVGNDENKEDSQSNSFKQSSSTETEIKNCVKVCLQNVINNVEKQILCKDHLEKLDVLDRMRLVLNTKVHSFLIDRILNFMVSDCSTQDAIDDNKKDNCGDSNEREYCANSNERECANNKDISSSCSDSSIDDVSGEIPLKGKDRKIAARRKERIEMKRNEIIKVEKKSELKQCEALREGSDVSSNLIFHLF